jgi:hypothetical protein
MMAQTIAARRTGTGTILASGSRISASGWRWTSNPLYFVLLHFAASEASGEKIFN